MNDIYSPGSGRMGVSAEPLDPSRCKEGVWSKERWSSYAQCARKAVQDGWCKQHHPDAVKLRDKAARERFDEQMNKAAFGWSGHVLVEALRKIADGDNDPRCTARDALRRCGILKDEPLPPAPPQRKD